MRNFYDMGLRAVQKGREGGPFAFIIPPDQHDPVTAARLEELLLAGAIEIQRAMEPFRADGEPYPEGTDIIFMTQPYHAYVKSLLERQSYPARRVAPNDPPERPYDVAGWSLPMQMGVNVITIERRFEPPLAHAARHHAAAAAGLGVGRAQAVALGHRRARQRRGTGGEPAAGGGRRTVLDDSRPGRAGLSLRRGRDCRAVRPQQRSRGGPRGARPRPSRGRHERPAAGQPAADWPRAGRGLQAMDRQHR